MALIAQMMGGGAAPAGPIDLSQMLVMPPCALCLVIDYQHPGGVAPAPAVTLVDGTLVCRSHAVMLLADRRRFVSIASRCICGDTYGPEDCPVHDGADG